MDEVTVPTHGNSDNEDVNDGFIPSKTRSEDYEIKNLRGTALSPVIVRDVRTKDTLGKYIVNPEQTYNRAGDSTTLETEIESYENGNSR